MHYQIDYLSKEILEIKFFDKLDIDVVAKIWEKCLFEIKQKKPQKLILDLEAVDYCDISGIMLLKKLQHQQIQSNRICELKNLKEEFQKLFDQVDYLHYKKIRARHIKDLSLYTRIGHKSLKILKEFKENISFLGKLCYQLFFVSKNLKKFRFNDFFKVAEQVGPKALPIVALIGFLIGLISTFQGSPSFGEFGAQILLINLVGLGLVREMGPLLTSVLLAGRTASSFSAEIGTMKINQEINALTTMGIEPIRFLVIPRIIATAILTPILEIFFIFFGLLGCFVVMRTLGYPFDAFMQQLRSAIQPMDYIGGLIKVFVFGIVIAGVGCLNGLKTSFGAQSVGRSTTKAVVDSLIMLILVDGVFALIYYIWEI